MLWVLAQPSVSHALEQAHQAAALEAFEGIDERWTITRRGRAGHSKVPGSMVMATFSHATSRALDPQLHIHGLDANLVLAADGTWGALEPRPIFAHQHEVDHLYQDSLSRRIAQLGLPTEPDRNSFRISLVPKGLDPLFSQRRKAVLDRLEETGWCGPCAAQMAALTTRPAKQQVSLATLRALWHQRALEWARSAGLASPIPDFWAPIAEDLPNRFLGADTSTGDSANPLDEDSFEFPIPGL